MPIRQMPKRSTPPVRKLPITFSMNALQRSHKEDEPSVREALAGEDRSEWQSAMEKRMKTLQDTKS